jgi:alginate O-acetyltransferase complex protein AlgI
MLFNSLDFAVFLPVIFVLYWFVTNRSLKLQNFLIVVASYFFYGWWDWRFLLLILFSTIVDFVLGLMLFSQQRQSRRKALLWVSVLVNIGLLGIFKYFNFFLDNFVAAFSFFGLEIEGNYLKIILPVGISFYTFQTLSYTIDIYKNKLEPTRDFTAFAAFVSFFPQLVAGPIERAGNLLPQFYTKRFFSTEKAADGLRQILWGLFKKMVIADNCAEYANLIFNNSSAYEGSTLILGAIFFSFQIYCDFSGYSDIAIGTARLFGFSIMQNFAFPYFSRDIAEFWRRWHISLSTWFRDYLYIPLGGSRGSLWLKVRNTFIIFIISGFWHGANWTFIIWGALNAVYFLPLLLTNSNRKNLETVAQGKYLPSFKEALFMIATYGATVFAWIFFRAENLNHAIQYVEGVFSSTLFKIPDVTILTSSSQTICLVIGFLVVEWLGRGNKYGIEQLALKWNWIYRYSFYYVIIALILWFGGEEQVFIYFQF